MRHCLLGLLASEPGSGYDLTRRFEEVLGAIRPARHPQIYGELTRLADDGLIAAETEGPRRRKEYRITDAGMAELRRWLTESGADHTIRLDPLLRSPFLWLLSPAELRAHLTAEAGHYRRLAGQCRHLATTEDDSPQSCAARLTAEAAARLYETLADWADWAKTTLPLAQEKADG